MRSLSVLLLVALASLPGCSWWRDENPCESVEEYQQSGNAAGIRVPAGLSSPDKSARLVIPAAPEPEQPLSANAACLQKPPNYFDKPLVQPKAD